MPVFWNPDTKEIHLRNRRISYIVRVRENGLLGHSYFGPALDAGRSYARLSRGEFRGFSNGGGEFVALEYPSGGTGDFRVPAIEIEHADGSRVLEASYAGHRIIAGKRAIPGLPSTYVEDDDEADTVEIDLRDAPSGITATLRYSVFRDYPAVARSARITNAGKKRVKLLCAMSANLDLADDRWEMLQLSGSWARERRVLSRPLVAGLQGISSLRGASGHQHNPFLVLKRPGTCETSGEAYGFSLVYSGNFLAEAETDQYGAARVRIGINPASFSWILDSGESFETPEAVLAYSATGLGDLSDAYHGLYRGRLARGAWRDKERPILINNWEGTYFNFTEAKLLEIARTAREAGIELFVLDDGWFGKRDDDASSLGDWKPDPRKLPEGIGGIAAKIEKIGMKFGLWFEPEMISRRSELFAEHPDWAIGIPGRPRTEFRNQYVLDFSRPEIRDHVFRTVSGILKSAPISYVKWDMNRPITEAYSPSLPPERQGEFFHRYILGVYELYDRLTREFPEILFESCAGGGGRLDPGILAFAPQAWTSDDTDAIERLRIQWGTSFCYPLCSMGAHVSAAPNHLVGRVTPLSTRAAAAFFGAFGYELDASVLSGAELKEITGQVAFYKEHRALFQRGRFLRLRSPYEGDGNETAWMVVSEDRGEAVVAYYLTLNRPNPGLGALRLRGLDPGFAYRVSTWPAVDDAVARNNAGLIGGDELIHVGLLLGGDGWADAKKGDFWSRIFVLESERG